MVRYVRKFAFSANLVQNLTVFYYKFAKTLYLSSVTEPEPQGAGTFAGARAIIMIRFTAPAPCYWLGSLKSSEKSILLVSSVDYA
jgi:hypothetical protein